MSDILWDLKHEAEQSTSPALLDRSIETIEQLRAELASLKEQNAKLIETLDEARDLIADAIEPDATQEKADVGMVTQWDVDAIKWLSSCSVQPAQSEG